MTGSGTNAPPLLLRYKSNDFHFDIDGNSVESPFDEMLKQKWEEAENRGVFRYKLNIKKWKWLAGKYQFIVQLNTDRGSNRRHPEDIQSMTQPFDPSRFNFTKISEKEILFDVGNGDRNDIIAVNVSPVECMHCMLICNRLACLPQRATQVSIRKVLEMMLLSASIYYRAAFNSLCSHASVNHLHWHLYYLKHSMPLEKIILGNFVDPVFELTDYPAQGFCLRLASFDSIESFARWIFAVMNYLQENEIAHSVYITRAKVDENKEVYDDMRVYIWPRESFRGVKETQAFIPAVCELFGHISIRTEEAYEDITEEYVAEQLRSVTGNSFYLEVRGKVENFLNEKGRTLGGLKEDD